MPKLTKRVVDALEPAAGDRLVWDTELRGFGLRIQASGVKAFVVQYRNAGGRSRRLTLGRYGVLTVDEARKRAQQTLAGVATGDDPAAERRSFRAAPTVDELLDRYLAEHVAHHNAETTRKGVEQLLSGHIRPRLGSLKVANVTRQDVLRFHKAMEDTPRQANHALSILSKAFNLAETWDLRAGGSNPCSRIKRYPEVRRERFLRAEELGRLGAALEEAETIGLPWSVDETKVGTKHLVKRENRRTRVSARALAVIRLLLFTGGRLSEVLSLRREHVDIANQALALPDRKGAKRVAHPVSAAALNVIQSVAPVRGSPWVFPRDGDAQRHIAKEVVENTWQRLRLRAEIPDVRLHDLRHTVGTYASQHGANAFVVRDLLRHQTLAMSGRYANRDADPIRIVSEAVGERITAGLANADRGVAPLKRRPGEI